MDETTDAMVAHRWFSSQFGEVMDGRDFSIKCQMADAMLAEARSESLILLDALKTILDLRVRTQPCDGRCEGCCECVARDAIEAYRSKPPNPRTEGSTAVK